MEKGLGWQRAPKALLGETGSARVALSRWSGTPDHAPLIFSSREPIHTHSIWYSLRKTKMNYRVGTSQVVTGNIPPHLMLLQAPGSDYRECSIFCKFDFLTVFFSDELLKDCLDTLYGRRIGSGITPFDTRVLFDPVMEGLMRWLANVDGDGDAYGPTFVDGLGLAIAARLVSGHARASGKEGTSSARPLSKSKLDRVIEYIHAQVDAPIRLAELSKIAELSQTHFAVQFRAATGYSPHNFILRHRVIRAQELLLNSDMSLAEISAVVGFRKQTHFSAIFKRFTGKPPALWKMTMTR